MIKFAGDAMIVVWKVPPPRRKRRRVLCPADAAPAPTAAPTSPLAKPAEDGGTAVESKSVATVPATDAAATTATPPAAATSMLPRIANAPNANVSMAATTVVAPNVPS